VILMFFVASKYFRNEAIGVAGALLLATTPSHFFYSRVGVDVVFMMTFILGWLYFALGAFSSDAPLSHASAIAATFVLGLSVYAYKAAQIVAPAYFALTVIFWFISRHGSYWTKRPLKDGGGERSSDLRLLDGCRALCGRSGISFRAIHAFRERFLSWRSETHDASESA